jgi:hypothetical protein
MMQEYKLRPIKFLWQLLNRTISEAKVYILGYRSYTALLTQAGVDAPTAIVLENTLGNVTFTYQIPGQYQAVLLNSFPELKTYLYIQPATTPDEGSISMYYSDINSIQITTMTPPPYLEIDEKLYNTTIEIRVYN